MDEGKFRDVEEKYNRLKGSMDRGEITADDLKRELKKLIVMDESGRYWMIGTKSGQWHMYDGTDWKVGQPYLQPIPAAPPAPSIAAVAPVREVRPEPVSHETVDTAEPEPPYCKYCKAPIPARAVFCPACGGNQRENAVRQVRHAGRDGEITLRAVKVFALASFVGGIGLILGVVAGASFGIFNLLPNLLQLFPILLRDAHGQIQGGLLFGAVGGIGGYVVFAVLGILLAWFYNFIAFVFGGLRFRTR